MRSTEHLPDAWHVLAEQELETRTTPHHSRWENHGLLYHGSVRGEFLATSSLDWAFARSVFAMAFAGDGPPTSKAAPSHRGARTSGADEIARLRDEQARLRDKVHTLEQRLDEHLATRRDEAADTEVIAPNAYTRWIEDNIEQLQRYPDEWIALHPERGIVFHTADGAAFDAWSDSLPSDERIHLMILHTSMYV